MVEMPITNPMDEPIVLTAEYGHASLTGPKTLPLAAGETSAFEFYFAPLVTGSGSSSVKLAHPIVGEFWYQVQHVATPSGAVTLPDIIAPVGRTSEHKVAFANPLESAQDYVLSVSSPRFALPTSILQLGPLEASSVSLLYTPDSIHTPEEAQLVIHNEVCPYHSRHCHLLRDVSAHVPVHIVQASDCDVHCRRQEHLSTTYVPLATRRSPATLRSCQRLLASAVRRVLLSSTRSAKPSMCACACSLARSRAALPSASTPP